MKSSYEEASSRSGEFRIAGLTDFSLVGQYSSTGTGQTALYKTPSQSQAKDTHYQRIREVDRTFPFLPYSD